MPQKKLTARSSVFFFVLLLINLFTYILTFLRIYLLTYSLTNRQKDDINRLVSPPLLPIALKEFFFIFVSQERVFASCREIKYTKMEEQLWHTGSVDRIAYDSVTKFGKFFTTLARFKKVRPIYFEDSFMIRHFFLQFAIVNCYRLYMAQ